MDYFLDTVQDDKLPAQPLETIVEEDLAGLRLDESQDPLLSTNIKGPQIQLGSRTATSTILYKDDLKYRDMESDRFCWHVRPILTHRYPGHQYISEYDRHEDPWIPYDELVDRTNRKAEYRPCRDPESDHDYLSDDEEKLSEPEDDEDKIEFTGLGPFQLSQPDHVRKKEYDKIKNRRYGHFDGSFVELTADKDYVKSHLQPIVDWMREAAIENGNAEDASLLKESPVQMSYTEIKEELKNGLPDSISQELKLAMGPWGKEAAQEQAFCDFANKICAKLISCGSEPLPEVNVFVPNGYAKRQSSLSIVSMSMCWSMMRMVQKSPPPREEGMDRRNRCWQVQA